MTTAYYYQKRLRLAQTVVLFGGMVLLAARAAAIVVGPVVGWIIVILAPLIAVHSLSSSRLMLPAGTRRLHPAEAPQLFDMLQRLVRVAGLEHVPQIYVLPSGNGEALTTGIGRQARLLLSRGLLQALSNRELLAVMAHEVSHIRNLDLPLFAMAGAMQRLTRMITGFLTVLVIVFFPLILAGVPVVPLRALLYMAVAPLVTVLVQFALLRTREFQADIGAAELTGDPDALASALSKLDALHQPMWNLFILTGQRRSALGELLRTHPSTAERIDRLRSLRRAD